MRPANRNAPRRAAMADWNDKPVRYFFASTSGLSTLTGAPAA